MRRIDPGDVTSPLVRELHRYWEGKRQNGALPRRGDIDPADISRLLPYVALCEVKLDEKDVTFRIAGDEVCRAYGIANGKRLSEVDPEGRLAPIAEAKIACARAGEPAFFVVDLIVDPDAPPTPCESAMLPLAPPSEGMALMLCLEDVSQIQLMPETERRRA